MAAMRYPGPEGVHRNSEGYRNSRIRCKRSPPLTVQVIIIIMHTHVPECARGLAKCYKGSAPVPWQD